MVDPIGNFTPPTPTPAKKPDVAGAVKSITNMQQGQADQTKALESQVTPMPEPPKQQQQGVDLKAHVGLFGAMMLLSALAARKTGAPMTAAMNNMTASLKGMQAGNAAIQQQQSQEMWQNFDAAMQQHKASLERYKIGLDALYKDAKNGPQKLYMQLLEEGYDPKLAAELSNPATAAKLYDAMLKGQQHAHEEADKVKHWQQVETDKKAAEFDKQINALEMKRAAATTDDLKNSYDEQIRLAQMRKMNALGGATPTVSTPTPSGGKPTPSAEDIAYAKAHPEAAAQFKAHFGVEPPK
jgi:hypothetical protein